jgi:hypothetical protein
MGLRWHVNLPGPVSYSGRVVPRKPRVSAGEGLAVVALAGVAGMAGLVAAIVHFPLWALGAVVVVVGAVVLRRRMVRREARRNAESHARALERWAVEAAPAADQARAWIREQYGREPLDEMEVLVVGTERFGMPLRP